MNEATNTDETKNNTTADSIDTNPATPGAPDVTTDTDETHFLVSSKPGNGVFETLADATAKANELAAVSPGTEIYIYESRRVALAPAPIAKDSELTQE